MAWKEDALFDAIPQAPPPTPRLMLEEHWNVPRSIVMLLLSFPMVVSAFLLVAALQDANVPALRFFVIPCFTIYGFAFLRAHLAQYRLYSESDRVYLPLRPMTWRKLLRHLAENPDLVELVGHQQACLSNPGVSLSSFRTLKYVFCISAVEFLLSLVSGYLNSPLSVLHQVQFVLSALIVAFLVLALMRITPGFSRFCVDGVPAPLDSSAFDEASRLSLRWDPLLLQEYLLVELGGMMIRYYNPTGDPLYLLRLWKQRMPGSALRVSPARE